MKKEKIVIIGGGGHSNVIIDMLLENGDYEVLGLIDKDPNAKNIFNIGVMGKDNDLRFLRSQGIKHAFVSIGNNSIRESAYKNLINLGFKLINVISKRSNISKYCTIANGVAIMPGATVNAGAKIGNCAIINTNSSVDHDCHISDFVHIAPGATLCGKVSVGEGSFVGVGSKIIDGIKVGKHCLVGGGSVVVKDIEDNAKVMGLPAKVVSIIDKI